MLIQERSKFNGEATCKVKSEWSQQQGADRTPRGRDHSGLGQVGKRESVREGFLEEELGFERWVGVQQSF